MSKIDLKVFNEYKNKKLIRSQIHNSLPLIIWNYTKECQYNGAWDDVTTLCRGLVTDTKGNIVAHPLRKFFNFSELKAWNKVPRGTADIYEKVDGSYIQLFNYNGEWIFSSKGSFHSPHAQHAEDILTNVLTPEGGDPYYGLDPELNYILELIHPDTRIVVDYGDRKDLVLLVMVDKTGEEYAPRNYYIDGKFSFPEYSILTHDVDNDFWEDARKEIKDAEEGIVVKFHKCGQRMKLKGDEYLRLHKIVTQTTWRDIWKAMRDGHDLRDFIERMPDEWIDWFHMKVGQLHVKYKLIEDQIQRDWDYAITEKRWPLPGYSYDDIPAGHTFGNPSRRQIAEYFQTCMYPKAMFAKLDNRDLDKWIWEQIEPHHEKAFML